MKLEDKERLKLIGENTKGETTPAETNGEGVIFSPFFLFFFSF